MKKQNIIIIIVFGALIFGLGLLGWRARPVWQGSLAQRPSRALLVLREPQGLGQTMRSQRNQRAGQRGACS